MPLQNRVTPTGEIISTPEKGRWMGNRGRLHDGDKRLGRARWQGRRWIICALKFGGRHRTEMMRPDSYTELFFLDEATALAAGHRPCAECRRRDYIRFMALSGGPTGADALDRALHAQRLERREKRTWTADATDLPDGTFIEDGNRALLIACGTCHLWSPGGYGPAQPLPQGPVAVLTPELSVEALRNGYAVQIGLG